MNARTALADAVGRYCTAPKGARRHVRIRRLLGCLEQVEPMVPAAGRILELGCGHGLFANLLASASPERDVVGIDIDARKIDAARTTEAPGRRLRFFEGDALAPPAGPFDAVVFVDVLYLFPPVEQRQALCASLAVLRPGGELIWKTQENTPAWKYWITLTQEFAATRCGLTRGAALEFPGPDELLAAVGAAGFVDARRMPIRGRIYSDVVVLARKRSD